MTSSGVVVALMVVTAATPDAGVAARLKLKAELLAVAAMLPLVDDPVAFGRPKNARLIATALKGLSDTDHLVRGRGAINRSIKGLFEADVATARAEFGRGEPEPARLRLRGLAGLCTGCHLRVSGANDTEPLDGALDRLDLSPQRRANLYLATRQFTKAERTWQALLAERPVSDADVFTQAGVLRSAVIFATRVRGEPAALINLLEPQAARTDFPSFVQRQVERWLADARAWAAAPGTCVGLPAEQALTQVRGLLSETGAATRLGNDDLALVPNMRAAACAQAVIEAAPPAPIEAAALHLLALAISTASEPALWQLDGLYLERCIELVPRTSQSQACFERLVDRVGAAYSGSMPSEYSVRLRALRALAPPAR